MFFLEKSGWQGRQAPFCCRMSRTRTIAKQKMTTLIESSGVNSTPVLQEAIAPGTTFRGQAQAWLRSLPLRTRKPLKPATLSAWRSYLDKWIAPALCDNLLADVGNKAVKVFIEDLLKAGLSDKSVVNIVQTVKMVVASAVNEDGEQIYRREWNHEFIGLPIVKSKDQNRPTLTGEEITKIVSKSDGQFQVLLALLAGTGMRIGGAQALEVKHVSPDGGVISVRQSVWAGNIQSPKTDNAIREIDVDPSVAGMPRTFIGDRKAGFVFCTSTGTALSASNVLGTGERARGLHPILDAIGLSRAGFHAFRRFRISWVRRNHVPEDLLRFWAGHADTSITHKYADQLKQDKAFRQEWAIEAGLGFELRPAEAEVGQLGQPEGTKSQVEMSA